MVKSDSPQDQPLHRHHGEPEGYVSVEKGVETEVDPASREDRKEMPEHPGHEHPDTHEESLQPETMGQAVHRREVEHEHATETVNGEDMHGPKPVAHVEHTGHNTHVQKTGHAASLAHSTHNEERMDHTQHGEHVDHTGHETMFRRRFWVSLVLSIPVLLYSPMLQMLFRLNMPAFPGSEWIGPIISAIIFLYGGLPFLDMARPEIRNRQPGMMTLISLAITVAFVYSMAALFIPDSETFFWELVTLIDIMLLGHWLEMRSVRQASGALNELAKLMPDTAERFLPNENTEQVPVSSLKSGDRVLVRPGASVPADGEVLEGASDVNEAMITGESKPVLKQPGDKVIAGTINGDGSLRVRVIATGDETALAGIMRLVQEAQQSKSNTQLLADQAAGWLFYIALAVAFVTAVTWSIATGINNEMIARVATVLVIACPHALGLAIPLVVAITTSLGAGNGILVRDRLALERAREIDMVIFDKTGTLTKGEFGVVGIQTVDGWDENEALALVAAVEGDSEHTIARGIRTSAEERSLRLPEVRNFEAIKGRGVQAQTNGRLVHVGGPRMIEMLKITLPQAIGAFERQAAAKGQSVVHLIVDQDAVASFALADVIRPESRSAVDRLHEMGVEVAMLTGDSQEVAQAVAEELGFDTYFAEVLPEHKDQKVAQLQKQGKRVAMVGDGVNDAPALTRADVGIAIGSGTDVAVESAGIILVRSDPMDAVNVIDLSRASYRKMIQNLIWATGYNVIALPLAAGILAPFGVILSPAVGAALMSISTIIVAFNAQLLRRHRLAA